ncbi:MAG: hypothetical protein IMX01_03440 [Limnochordaceae bacterium]|nr:hypothetical protein [Limnochordaceae bacterium]
MPARQPPHQRTLCVDFDGTITDYDHYRGRGVFDPPLPGAVETLQRLKTEGWKILIYTTRSEVDEIARYLQAHGIPYDGINRDPDGPSDTNAGKPAADAYLDDRAVPFRDDWEAAYRGINELLEWKRARRARRRATGPVTRAGERRPGDQA